MAAQVIATAESIAVSRAQPMQPAIARIRKFTKARNISICFVRGFHSL